MLFLAKRYLVIQNPAAKDKPNPYPQLEFTSGRRNVPQQAHAMAYNIVKTGGVG